MYNYRMKKTLFSLFFLLLFACGYFIQAQFGFVKVLDVVSPTSVYLDLNNKLIFDEKEPIVVENIFFIDKNTD